MGKEEIVFWEIGMCTEEQSFMNLLIITQNSRENWVISPIVRIHVIT